MSREILTMPPAGYSGTPLAKKLGLKPGMRAWAEQMPASVADEIGASLPGFEFATSLREGTECAHVFVRSRKELAAALKRVPPKLAAGGMLWISWPKKASGVATDVTEDTIRELALPLGLVDVKVCAVDAVWSGLKLVVRRALR